MIGKNWHYFMLMLYPPSGQSLIKIGATVFGQIEEIKESIIAVHFICLIIIRERPNNKA
jgi:hypothetical protein